MSQLLFLITSSLLLLPTITFVSCAHVFLIDPNSYDSSTKIVAKTWQEKDYTTESDGGILVFDGALSENTRLEIRNIKARKIEVMATFFAGSTLLIENFRISLVASADGRTPLYFSAEHPGGILIAPTIFRSSDGKFGC